MLFSLGLGGGGSASWLESILSTWLSLIGLRSLGISHSLELPHRVTAVILSCKLVESVLDSTHIHLRLLTSSSLVAGGSHCLGRSSLAGAA